MLGLFAPLQSHADNVPAAPTILVLGDSLSAAHNIPLEQGWVALLQQRLAAQADTQAQPRAQAQAGPHWQVVNASISGETSGGGAARIGALLEQHPAQILILELGGNDGLRGLPINQFKDNLSAIIRQAQQAETQVLLAGIQIPTNYGAAYRRRFTAVYTDLAEQFHVPLVPFLLENVVNRPEWMQADGIHPTAAAQTQILENLWPQLAPLMQDSAEAGT